jgi:polygalacturonase
VLIQPVDRKTFEQRTFPGTYRSVVYEKNGYYYAKNEEGSIICQNSSTACIQEAIDYVSTLGGGEVLIRSGVYKIDQTIQPKSYVAIRGSGISTVLLKTPNINPDPDFRYRVFFGRNVSNVVIENLVVDGNKNNLTWSGTAWDYHSIRFDYSSDVDIRNVVVRYVKAGAGIVSYKNTRVRIINNTIHDNGSASDSLPSDAIYVGHSIDVIVAGNFVRNVTDTGIGCDNNNDVIIIGNRYINTSSNGIAWYNIDNDPPFASRGIIMGNIIQGAELGILIDKLDPNAPYAEKVLIMSNIILNTTTGIEIASAKDVLIVGNYIDTTTYAGIHTNNPNSSNIRIINNIVANGSVFGIGNEGNVADIYIAGNTLINNWHTIAPLMGIVKGNIGFPTEKSGVAVFSGDGSKTQFEITHGLVSKPNKILITPGSSDASRSNFYVTADDAKIYVNFATPPPAGTNNVVLYWYAEI